MMDDISEGDSHKEDEPASPAPPPSQQHTDPASPTVAVTPEPVVRGERATASEIEYQVRARGRRPRRATSRSPVCSPPADRTAGPSASARWCLASCGASPGGRAGSSPGG